MIAMADVIVSLWFLPVILFIIIPLAMLCGWLLFKLSLPLWRKRDESEEKEDVVDLAHFSKTT